MKLLYGISSLTSFFNSTAVSYDHVRLTFLIVYLFLALKSALLPASAQHQHRKVQFPNEFNARSVSAERQVEAAKPVARHAVRAAAHHDRARLEGLHALRYDLVIK